ncbi:MAG: hypothetical protein EOQ86_31080 [Mesorhizobium sp.]|uniref:hypothetical protein n=1 Tax=Mesorhizobium sp. TaxID=1871066 RepID=UPI000FEAA998|nr:hypothetical protein [Mesorhizobium sp.]RWH69576.1 MAG: hypothetical protein EOQ85_32720 [Mesorhizobium sp.]RWH76041.1 MAG: hypothetical protein EOQ86_31080 [Mesorhizobium sp.]RWH83419.1 MAG: hypothetical protein EOQ87_32880 [Mesorhizobium sp.]RWH91322.1 MAG: hypothetical protein EOQ88_32400 [Mesorhizobium sp.]RWI04733.1 MAG: hypothetical protein EOQ89_09170 [Mesorhizobium sp.]
MTTSESVVEILVQEGGYRELPRPLKVGSLSFEFTSALVAGERANDLVIVIELKGDTDDDGVIRKVLALTRALDVMHSKRPVTAVLTSGQASADTIQSIGRVCRVLPVGAPTGPKATDAVRDWLSVLLPLARPQAADTLLDWEGDLRRVLAAKAGDPLVENLLDAAIHGKVAVEGALAGSISASVKAALAEDEEDD